MTFWLVWAGRSRRFAQEKSKTPARCRRYQMLCAAVDAQMLNQPCRVGRARFLEVPHIGVADRDAIAEIFFSPAGQRGAKFRSLLALAEEILECLPEHHARKLRLGFLAGRFDRSEDRAENISEHKIVVANVGDYFAVFVFKGREAAA